MGVIESSSAPSWGPTCVFDAAHLTRKCPSRLQEIIELSCVAVDTASLCLLPSTFQVRFHGAVAAMSPSCNQSLLLPH